MRFCFIVALFRYCFWSKSQQGGKIGIYNHSFFFDDRYFVGIDICYASSLYAYHGRGMKVVYSHAYDSDFAVSGKKEETARKNFLKRRSIIAFLNILVHQSFIRSNTEKRYRNVTEKNNANNSKVPYSGGKKVQKRLENCLLVPEKRRIKTTYSSLREVQEKFRAGERCGAVDKREFVCSAYSGVAEWLDTGARHAELLQ